MAKSYYSTVFDESADHVWSAIRDFGHYQWAGSDCIAVIEEGRSGDAVGSIRSVRGERPVRQRLLAHSDLERFYTYEFCDPCPFPIRNYLAALRVTPIIDGNKAFVEWSATFDCADEEYDYWTTYFETTGFATWLNSLRAKLSS